MKICKHKQLAVKMLNVEEKIDFVQFDVPFKGNRVSVTAGE